MRCRVAVLLARELRSDGAAVALRVAVSLGVPRRADEESVFVSVALPACGFARGADRAATSK
jgi:hypothetical protein